MAVLAPVSLRGCMECRGSPPLFPPARTRLCRGEEGIAPPVVAAPPPGGGSGSTCTAGTAAPAPPALSLGG